jgi:hypothetical protein
MTEGNIDTQQDPKTKEMELKLQNPFSTIVDINTQIS